MKWQFLIIGLLFSTPIFAQQADSLDLMECFRQARTNSPLWSQLENNQHILALKEEANSTGNLPQITAFGKAWYQSDAVTVPPFAPGAEGLAIDRFQYNVGAEINQKLFDGGFVNKLSRHERSTSMVNNASTEVSIYQVYQQVSDLYFSILLMEQNLDALELKLQYLTERQKSLESAFENGVVLPSDLHKLKVEQLTVEQQKTELTFTIQYLKKNLIIVTGLDEDMNTIPIKRAFRPIDLTFSKRPEYTSLAAQEQQALTSKDLISNNLSPKMYAYGQLGYSYPGLNFFENQSAPYYIVGFRLAWNIYDWNKSGKEKEVIDVRIKNLRTLEADLDRKFETAELVKLAEIEKINELIKLDKDIIDLKTTIVQSSGSALDNGTISFSDYLLDVNAEIISRIDRNKHTIELYKNQVELALIKGINIE